jgi:hypothetical protein
MFTHKRYNLRQYTNIIYTSVSGIGFGMICLTGIVCIYYNVIIAWTLYYLLYSFFPTIPWSTCDNDFNTDACYQIGQHLIVPSNYNDTVIYITRKTATEEFWEYVQHRGESREGGAPPKIGKNMIFWRKIVIFHTKCPKYFRSSLRHWKKYDFLS